MTSHAMARRKLLFEYAYRGSQILKATCALIMNILIVIFGGILFLDDVLSICHIKKITKNLDNSPLKRSFLFSCV